MDTNQPDVAAPVPVTTEVATELPSIGSLFSKTWSFIGNNLGRLLLISVLSLLINIPGVVVSFVLQSFARTEQELVSVLVVATVATVLTLIGSVVSMALVTATTVAGKTMSIKETFRYALRLWWPLTLTVFFAYAVIFAGFLFLLVPGLILSVLLLPVLWVMAVEGLTARAALERSIVIVSGRWWSVWWKVTVAILFVLVSMLLLVLAFALAAPALFIVGMANMMVAAIVGGVVGALVYITLISLATFFIARYTYELYCGLVATVSPEAKSWWQGLPLSILLPVGTVIGIIYILAMPYLAVLDAQKAPEPSLQFDEEEVDFDAWLEANPEFRNQFDNPTSPESI